ncbi:MAG: MmgE/PrpD family protein [Anaerolineales bacterium]|nr:MAG: MmgE/PrpD family protein [Anaerolineales bacterium]
MTATRELISFVRNLDHARLPADVVAKAKHCVLDLIGVAIAGSQTSMARVSTQFARAQFSPGQASVIGSHSRMSEVGASWVNGICASALDMDDGHRQAMGHPGAAVIPSALAVAESVGASGREFLTAVVAGYEIATRASVAMLPDYRAGRYSTGLWGGFGSATAASKLLKFDSRHYQSALGIVGMHGPSPAGGDFMHQSMVKEAIAWAGLAGCSSVFQAQSGFTGPEDVLDRSGRYDTHKLVIDLGQVYAIQKTYFKPYASCRWSHPAIDGALLLVRQEGLRLEEIHQVHLEGFQPLLMLVDYTPTSTVAAQYSVPFSLALALAWGRIGPGELTEANLQDAQLLELARRVKISVDPELNQLFPDKTAIRVTLHTSRGDFTTTVEYPKGDPANPLSHAELVDKFRWLTVDILGEERSQALMELIDALEQMDDLKPLTRLLVF